MPKDDFRTARYQLTGVRESGQYIGSTYYWKLYVLENLARIVIMSVLTVQLGRNWWSVVTNVDIENRVARIRAGRRRRPYHSYAGAHSLYNVYLSDLTQIIRTNSNQFRPVFPEIDQWLLRLERIQQPRNLVSHMNWINARDRIFVDAAYKITKEVIQAVDSASIPIRIPRKY